MTKEIQHPVGSETVTVHLTVLKGFEECKEDMKSPFKHMEEVAPAGFDPNNYENIFIKCEIRDENRIMTLRTHRVSGESVCHEVVDAFLKARYPGRQLRNHQSIFCNHFELQYRYLII